MKDLSGQPVLARVINRVRRATTLDEVVVATSTKPADDVITEFCEAYSAPVFRGSELDVLDRYVQAARAHAADVVVRITSDCPLIEPEILDRVVHAFVEARPSYACNTMQRLFPRGLDVEVMSMAALERAWRETTEGYQRVHVTPYFYQNPTIFPCLSVTDPENHGSYRWTVDTVEDLEFVRAIYSRLGPGDAFGWRDVLELLHHEPELARINCGVQQKSLEEG